MVKREDLVREVRSALRRSRAVALIGPRQCGKTTLARQFVSAESPTYLDLEDPSSHARLDEPMTALRNLKGLVVIDEDAQCQAARPESKGARGSLLLDFSYGL